jgi:hypothetical protein
VSAIDLKSLLSEESIGIHEIGDAIDAASPTDRIDAVFALDRDGQRTLFRKAEAATPLTLDDFVPADRGPRTPVRHRGRNTLPFPARHKLFNKCFCRPDDESTRLFGYNDAPSQSWVGPGYFVAEPTVPADWQARGAIVVDYFRISRRTRRGRLAGHRAEQPGAAALRLRARLGPAIELPARQRTGLATFARFDASAHVVKARRKEWKSVRTQPARRGDASIALVFPA